MRALLMAMFSFDFPGHGVDRWAGRGRARSVSTKTPATKTTAKTV